MENLDETAASASDDSDVAMPDNPPITLRTAVEDSGETIRQVQVEELSVAQLEARESIKNDYKRAVYSMSDATGLSPLAIRQLKAFDFRRISKRMGELSGTEDDTDTE